MPGHPPIWDPTLSRFIYEDASGNWHTSGGDSVSAPAGRMPFGHAGRHRPGGVDDMGLAPIALSGVYADLTGVPQRAVMPMVNGDTPGPSFLTDPSGQCVAVEL